jgi:hypothetical protein
MKSPRANPVQLEEGESENPRDVTIGGIVVQPDASQPIPGGARDLSFLQKGLESSHSIGIEKDAIPPSELERIPLRRIVARRNS